MNMNMNMHTLRELREYPFANLRRTYVGWKVVQKFDLDLYNKLD